jgi:CheY-like chemotaxis protein
MDRQDACVLVAEDDPDLRELLCDMLQLAGFRAVPASDGTEVLDLVVRERPALILLDVLMPTMDGYTTLARLQGDLTTRDIPAIMLTGRVEPIYRTLSAGLGAVAHLTKPVSARALTDTIRPILDAALGWSAARASVAAV